MRILMISTLCFPHTIGGVENHIYYLSKALTAKGHYVEIICPIIDIKNRNESSRPRVETLEYEGLLVHQLYLSNVINKTVYKLREKFSGSSFWGMLTAFAQKASYGLCAKEISNVVLDLVNKNNFQLLHQHDFSANLKTSRIISNKIPVVLTNHTGEFLYLNRNKFTRVFLKNSLKHYKAVIGPSNELALMPNGVTRGVYIPNGVDSVMFYPLDHTRKSELKGLLGFDEDSIIVFCPRRWAPTKGIVYLCDAIRDITIKFPKIKFLFAGSDYHGYPDYKKLVTNKLQELKEIDIDNYLLLGDLNAKQMQSYYQISDVVVIPSLMEATSLAALEAMASGVTVIATNVGGMDQIICNGETGILIPPANSKKIIEALSHVIENPELRYKIGTKSRAFVENDYSWLSIADKTIEVYKRVLTN